MAVLTLCSVIAIAADINGRFVVTHSDTSKVEVLLQINTSTVNNALGGATIVFNFDTTSLNISNVPVKDIDYVFHNFDGNSYSTATITEPRKGIVWINIDLPFNNSSQGTMISDTSGWTDIVTIYFNILDVNGTANFYWQTNSPFWGIYKDDNYTLIEPNVFPDLSFLYDTTPPELVHATLLDSVNLEIEFSELVDSTTALDISNYSIDNGIQILDISKTSSPDKFVINTTAHSLGYQYMIVVKNLYDYSGNLISAEHHTEEYTFSPNNLNEENLPAEFFLSQNFPNPFNPVTTIKWQSPIGSHQSLKVYDVLGNEVATLIDEYKPAGSYETEFNSENLASGVYFYCLKTAEFTQTKKMLLLR